MVCVGVSEDELRELSPPFYHMWPWDWNHQAWGTFTHWAMYLALHSSLCLTNNMPLCVGGRGDREREIYIICSFMHSYLHCVHLPACQWCSSDHTCTNTCLDYSLSALLHVYLEGEWVGPGHILTPRIKSWKFWWGWKKNKKRKVTHFDGTAIWRVCIKATPSNDSPHVSVTHRPVPTLASLLMTVNFGLSQKGKFTCPRQSFADSGEN